MNFILAIFVKPQQWPTPSESIAIYCVRKLVLCITHLQSCAKVDIRNKKKKLRTVAKIKTQGYKNWRLPKFSTNVTPPLNTATTDTFHDVSQKRLNLRTHKMQQTCYPRVTKSSMHCIHTILRNCQSQKLAQVYQLRCFPFLVNTGFDRKSFNRQRRRRKDFFPWVIKRIFPGDQLRNQEKNIFF